MYNYDDIIEYIDGTNDSNFNNAALWAISNDAQLIELMDRRDLPKRYFQIVKNPEPEPTPPTYEEIKQMRIQYRREHIDDQTSERSRKMANGTWTEEDEQAYLTLDIEVTAWIEENLPYPEQ